MVLAGGVLAIYLATARQQSAAPAPKPSHQHGQPLKVVKVQTIGVIDFGPADNGDPGPGQVSGHALMLLPRGHEIDFVPIPKAVLVTGQAVWTANQMSDNSEIFIYVPTGRCLAGTPAGHLALTPCKLEGNQRWRPVNSRVVQGQAIAQYKNVETGECLAAPPGSNPGLAFTTSCGTSGTKTQEIAFWWSA